ncbi:Glutathione S-transferase domain protein [Dickeya chrysanthemi Ech1591]|uniref:Glutathione S-transferase domain protein n=1 Tax=Dickeya chrysanthemi (strain Ech1591) TaxID=561229 RepID=C6CL94_DICC1|nr:MULTISPECIES: glutathione S-transferase family protein [Dickeya]ACT07340.1 Glutathione S-transferase domain protein [Dickeya chrysanthemi Ech1591]TYL41540.1 glutathione S-transferase family protein [Dickeya sp. ws52]
MYQLHIANKNYSSWSLRPWILLKALDIPFEEILTPFASAPVQTAFKAFSPTGKVPCLVDGDITVWDSLSIIEYLAEAHPAVWPQDKAARAWARSAAAEMHSGFSALRNQCSMSCGVRVTLHTLTPALQSDIDRLNQLWQEGIQRFGGPFLAGAQFSAVDAFFAPVVFRAQTYGLPLTGAAAHYVSHLLAQPAMQLWYRQALAETWRESGHEEDIAASGRIIQDERAAS